MSDETRCACGHTEREHCGGVCCQAIPQRWCDCLEFAAAPLPEPVPGEAESCPVWHPGYWGSPHESKSTQKESARCPECLSDSRKYGNMRPCANHWHTERPQVAVGDDALRDARDRLHDNPDWDKERITVRKSINHPGDSKDPHDIDCPCYGDFDCDGTRVIHAVDCRNCECVRPRRRRNGTKTAVPALEALRKILAEVAVIHREHDTYQLHDAAENIERIAKNASGERPA